MSNIPEVVNGEAESDCDTEFDHWVSLFKGEM